MKKFPIFMIALLICTGAFAAATTPTSTPTPVLTPQQVYNINTETEITVSLWEIKSAYQSLIYESNIVNAKVKLLQSQGIKVADVNWSDIKNIGLPDWSVLGYGK